MGGQSVFHALRGAQVVSVNIYALDAKQGSICLLVLAEKIALTLHMPKAVNVIHALKNVKLAKVH